MPSRCRPTASLPADEVERLFAAMRGLKARNVGMVYVSHRLDEIFKVADRVMFLYEGHAIFFGPIADLDKSEHPHIREFLAMDRMELTY